MDHLEEFKIPEEALDKLKDPKILRRQVEEGKTFQEIIGYSEETMQKFYSAAYQLFQREQYREAADAFIFLTTLNPYMHNYWLGLGMSEQKQEKYHEALMAYGMAVLTDGTNPVAHYHSAFCYRATGEEAKAIGSLAMAIECAGDDPAQSAIKEHAIAAKRILEA